VDVTIRAKVSAKRGEDDRALHDLESALALDGRCATAYSVRAEVRACCGDLAGAAEDALAGTSIHRFNVPRQYFLCYK
jgi:hypothetical protein